MRDQWINERCCHNFRYINGKIKAVVISFHGLNARYRDENTPLEFALAESNILVIAPYYGPWSWMNRQARAFVDELLDHVFAELGDENIPLIASGGSMGGCAALLFCRYSKHRPVACDAVWPVCDTVAHFSERPDLPPTFHQAFLGYAEPMEELLKEHSPLHQIEALPRIPYLFTHGLNDVRVNKAIHSDRMVSALIERGHQVEYAEVPGCGHGVSVPLSVTLRRLEFIRRFAEDR